MIGNNNRIESEAQAFLKHVDDFATALVAKGYHRFFMINGAYPGRLAQSLKQYLMASMMGKETGMANGISLRTYLQWEGDRKDAVQAYFTVVCGHLNRLNIKSMEIVKVNPDGVLISHLSLGPLEARDIPTCRKALQMLDDPEKNKMKQGIKM